VEALIGKFANILRQALVSLPEPGAGEMPHSSRAKPFR
jgi:hypothetical protein